MRAACQTIIVLFAMMSSPVFGNNHHHHQFFLDRLNDSRREQNESNRIDFETSNESTLTQAIDQAWQAIRNILTANVDNDGFGLTELDHQIELEIFHRLAIEAGPLFSQLEEGRRIRSATNPSAQDIATVIREATTRLVNKLSRFEREQINIACSRGHCGIALSIAFSDDDLRQELGRIITSLTAVDQNSVLTPATRRFRYLYIIQIGDDRPITVLFKRYRPSNRSLVFYRTDNLERVEVLANRIRTMRAIAFGQTVVSPTQPTLGRTDQNVVQRNTQTLIEFYGQLSEFVNWFNFFESITQMDLDHQSTVSLVIDPVTGRIYSATVGNPNDSATPRPPNSVIYQFHYSHSTRETKPQFPAVSPTTGIPFITPRALANILAAISRAINSGTDNSDTDQTNIIDDSGIDSTDAEVSTEVPLDGILFEDSSEEEVAFPLTEIHTHIPGVCTHELF